jgi:hypothetical protein
MLCSTPSSKTRKELRVQMIYDAILCNENVDGNGNEVGLGAESGTALSDGVLPASVKGTATRPQLPPRSSAV